MTPKVGHLVVGTVILLLIASTAFAEKGRIYGKIYTDRGDILEGIIRWDKNEASWDDMIDANKEREHKEKAKKGRRKYGDDDKEFSIFGITVYKDGSSWGGSISQSAIAFGHLERLTRDGNDAELLLKSGQEVLFENASSDLGSGIREIVIETRNEGELELDWDDIDYVEFMEGGNVDSDFGNRNFGTVTTSRGGEFTGWICWDMDEMFSKDIIDGQDRRRKRKIKFEDIARIERISSQAALIVTKDGKEIRLDDSNDVDSGNRGIVVSDLKMGRVIVEWDEFESLELKEPSSDDYPLYSDYDGGHRLYGTVYDEDGESYSGYIRWDNDEEYSWEIIDGNYRGVEFDIALENIASIEKHSRSSAKVILKDGRSYRLRDSNDVNDENKGIYISQNPDSEDEDGDIYLDWEDFSRVDFSRK